LFLYRCLDAHLFSFSNIEKGPYFNMHSGIYLYLC
jgi:hypothetical protein